MRRRNDGAAVAMTAMLVSGMLLLSACGSADAVKTDFDVGLRHLRDPGAFAYGVLLVVEERNERPLFGL